MNKMLSFLSHEDIIAVLKKTPDTRDRYVDFLRAFSILVVVFGHWLSAVVITGESCLRVCNAVGMINGLWIITWILQVMPLFFFVGGFSNARTLKSLMNQGKPVGVFYRKRGIRLLKPTIIFVLIWILILVVLILFVPDWKRYIRIIIAIIGPLWFIVVYLFITLISPFMLKFHRTACNFILLSLAVLIGIIDFLRFKMNIPFIAWFNVLFVWLFVHQLGFFYEDGTLINIQKWQKFLIAMTGLLGLIVLTNTGIYPKSMIGTGFEKLSNMNPPTICIMMLSLWLVGLVMFLREGLNKWLKKETPWLITILANRTIMTLYLWHLTAYAIAYLLLYQIGFGHFHIDNLRIWWLERPVWIIIPGIILLGLIKVFGRFESPG